MTDTATRPAIFGVTRAKLRDTLKRALADRFDLAPEDRYNPPLGDDFKVLDEADPNGPRITLDYVPAPDLEELGEYLIDSCPEFEHLAGRRIVYLWKREGGTSGGKATLGKCQRATGVVGYLTGADWLVWLAADHVYNSGLTRAQVEALLHHELCHAWVKESDGELVPSVLPHDFEGFLKNVQRYGAWMEDLKLAEKVWHQPALFENMPGYNVRAVESFAESVVSGQGGLARVLRVD